MAHRTLIGGTAYSITGGKSMVSGTSYSIAEGRTLIGGTGYNISFQPKAYAMLYSSGNMVFQYGSDVASGETLTNSYKGFESVEYSNYSDVPWYNSRNNIKNVSVVDEVAPTSLAYWFHSSENLVSVNLNRLN